MESALLQADNTSQGLKNIIENHPVLSQIDFSAGDESLLPKLTTKPNVPETVLKDIEEASARGDLSAVKAALEKYPDASSGRGLIGALFQAITNKRSCMIEYLLSQGAPLEPVHINAATENGDTDALDLIVKHGWDINTPMAWSVAPPLELAVENADLTAWFLAHGADPNARCVLDQTPLSSAVMFAKFPVIQTLFDHGGSVQHGQLLHYAVRRHLEDTIEVLRFLLSKGAPVNDVMFQNHLDSYNLQKAFGLGTPLHEAADVGKLDVVRFLLENGANALVKDSLGRTPLQRAERNQQHSVAELLRGAMTIASPWPCQFTDEH